MALTAGTRLGPYEIQSALGAGGMGEVYRARDTELGRDVAVKVLPGLVANNPAWLARFRHEAKLLASLNHPNICIIYGLGESPDQHFIVMEFVEGKPLAAVISSGALAFASVVLYGIQIADALVHAHTRGIIHRDLKSSNVIITTDGRAKVLDFGLAIGVGQSVPELTTVAESMQAGRSALVGTLPYMAPEILRGEIADARSDLWALGVVLYEMTTGALPFMGTTAFELSTAIMRDPTPYPANSKLDPLYAVIERCLAKNPVHRYQSAIEVRAALESLQAVAAPGRRRQRRRSESRRQAPAGASIAVLPFTNLSPEPDQEYFCDGITEEIINRLTRIPGLHVAARTSAFRFRGRTADVGVIGKRLNVSTVLEGSVRKAGSQLRITANLISTSDGYQLWSEQWDREVREVFAIQDEIAQAIVETLRIRLSPQRGNRSIDVGTETLTAYNLYLQGRFQVNKRRPEALLKAIEHFEQAAIADPRCAPAYAGMADAYCLLAIHAPIAPRMVMPKAKVAAVQAVTLNEALGPAHTSLGFIHATYDWDWPGAEREFLRAIELNPGDSNAHHWYGIDCLSPLGRLDEALVELTRALDLDPLSLSINISLGGLFHDRREYDRAIDQYRTAIELEPNFYFSHWNLGRTYEQLGRYEQAMETFQKALSLAPGNYLPMTQIARCHALMGNPDEARKLLGELIELKTRMFIPSTSLALIHFCLGEIDRGFELMHAACEERTVWLIWSKVSAIYDPVRADPRFVALLERLRL